MQTTNKERIHGPDILRGLAAIGVILFHVYYLSGIPHSPLAAVLFSRFDFLVRLFFAISAFSICYAYSNRLESQQQLKGFYINRFFRIAPLFYLILTFTILLNYILNNSLPDPYNLVLSFTFLFPFVPGKHGSLVGGGWSLGIEWMFYIFLPLILCFVKSWRTAIFAWAVTCSISLFRYDYFGAEEVSASLKEYGILFFLSHLPFFMVGVACFFAMRDLNYGRSTNPWGPTLRGITLVSCFVLSMIYFSKQWSNSVAEEIFISFISYFLIMNSISKLPVWIDNGATRYLGKISYSVYLTQFPVITILYSSGAFSNIASHTSSTSIAYALAALLTVSLVISVSSVTYKYIEAPLIRLGKRSYRPLPSRPEAT